MVWSSRYDATPRGVAAWTKHVSLWCIPATRYSTTIRLPTGIVGIGPTNFATSGSARYADAG
jgi:hypothetical protein